MCLYRHFLQELPTTVNKYKSGIKSHLKEEGTLNTFTSLRCNTLNWNMAKQSYTVESNELSLCFLPPAFKTEEEV